MPSAGCAPPSASSRRSSHIRAFEELAGELKWLSDLLGAARDCDVLISEFLDRSEIASRQGHRRAPRRRRIRLWPKASLRAACVSSALDLASLRSMQEAGQGAGAAACRAGARAVAGRSCLARRLKKLLKRARHLEKLDAHKRHRVRIAAKKLRYMGEFFETLLAGKTRKGGASMTVIRQLEKVQKGLGVLQDEVTFRRSSPNSSARPRPSASPRPRLSTARRSFARPSRAVAKLANAKPFWLKWQKDEKDNQE